MPGNDPSLEPERLAEALRALGGAATLRSDEIRVVRAPGRVNLIGEHTDYNDGFVLPAAIDLGITIALVPTDDRRVELTRLETGERLAFELDGLPSRKGDWSDYVVGTAWALLQAGADIGGFRGVLASNLPAGAGLSSSAALELAVAWALGGGEAPLDHRLAVALAARRAENEFVSVPSGVMDQFAVAFGEAHSAIFLDCRSLEHRLVPLPDGVLIAIADSGIRRSLRAPEYAERRAACERTVRHIGAVEPGVRSLRDVTPELLEASRSRLDEIAYRRARHVVAENRRVLEVVAVMESGRLDALGPLFAAGHASLRDDFEVSIPELDRLVELAVETPGVLGARLTGAGFGGSIVALGPADALDAFTRRVDREYRPVEPASSSVRLVRAAAGAGRVA